MDVVLKDLKLIKSKTRMQGAGGGLDEGRWLAPYTRREQAKGGREGTSIPESVDDFYN